MSEQMNETAKLPLWKHLAERMIEEGLDYGQSWPVEFFEHELRCSKDSIEFAFAMMSLRGLIETDEGYYIQSAENGKLYSIPKAPTHEEIAARLDKKLRRCAVRSINIRSATLSNPKAELTAGERADMERNLEHAAVRLVLMSRTKSVVGVIKEHKPELLKLKR